MSYLQISLCFFICQELCWMRGLWINFTSSCFLFPVRGGVKSLRTGGLKNFKTGRVINLEVFLLGGQYPITCHNMLLLSSIICFWFCFDVLIVVSQGYLIEVKVKLTFTCLFCLNWINTCILFCYKCCCLQSSFGIIQRQPDLLLYRQDQP